MDPRASVTSAFVIPEPNLIRPLGKDGCTYLRKITLETVKKGKTYKNKLNIS